MDAGRELDTLVAERVMGWKVFVGEPGHGRRAEKPISLVLDTIPLYSTDIAAAWEVVERITRIPQSLAEAKHAANTRFAYWFDRSALWSMSASEAAHAICLAALHAMEV